MFIMIRPEYKIAFEKAAQINKILSVRAKKDGFVPLDDIIKAVQIVSNYSEINVERVQFSKIDFPQDFDKSVALSCGAMLNTVSRKTPQGKDEEVAYLIINSDFDANMQRFSVAHELGHLITEVPNFVYETIDDGQSTLSAHINADITYWTEEECEGNSYLVAEQVANIFALLVLIPDDLKIRNVREYGAEDLAKKYGVTEDAIYSRMLLTSVKIT